jgi:Na+-driven multidrug efflux pump
MRGAGYTKVPMLINFVSLFGIRISLAYALGFVLGWGLLGIWVGMTIETFIRAAVIYAVFRRGTWTNVAV